MWVECKAFQQKGAIWLDDAVVEYARNAGVTVEVSPAGYNVTEDGPAFERRSARSDYEMVSFCVKGRSVPVMSVRFSDGRDGRDWENEFKAFEIERLERERTAFLDAVLMEARSSGFEIELKKGSKIAFGRVEKISILSCHGVEVEVRGDDSRAIISALKAEIAKKERFEKEAAKMRQAIEWLAKNKPDVKADISMDARDGGAVLWAHIGRSSRQAFRLGENFTEFVGNLR